VDCHIEYKFQKKYIDFEQNNRFRENSQHQDAHPRRPFAKEKISKIIIPSTKTRMVVNLVPFAPFRTLPRDFQKKE
jgi:hypothetical protein